MGHVSNHTHTPHTTRLIGATVARQIPDLKVTCSNHVWVTLDLDGLIGATVARQIPDLKVTCSNHVWVKSTIAHTPLNDSLAQR